jgi:tetratricopeptide (TPR) repeat protein
VPRRPSNHVDDPVAVGARIRSAREAAGLTQRELAFEGCTAAYLSRIEVGQRIPSYQILRVLAGRLGTTADFLATGAEPGSEDVDPLFEAEVAVGTGDVEHGRALYEAAARGEDAVLAARAEAALGRLAFDTGDHELAAEHLGRALTSGRLPDGDRTQVQDVLGRALALLARYEESLAVLELGLAEANSVGDDVTATRFSVLLANLLIDRGSYERAEQLLAQILDTARAATDPLALSNLYWSQARLHSSQQRIDLAARYARLAHATLESSEHTVNAARALVLVAHLENDRGNHGEALERVDEGAAVLAAAGNRYDEGMLLLEKARALAALGHPEDAASIALGAVPRFEHAQPGQKGRSYAIAAGVLKSVGDSGRALELYELAAETIPTPDRLSTEVYRSIAEIHEAEGRPDEAMAALKRALAAQDPAHRSA